VTDLKAGSNLTVTWYLGYAHDVSIYLTCMEHIIMLSITVTE